MDFFALDRPINGEYVAEQSSGDFLIELIQGSLLVSGTLPKLTQGRGKKSDKESLQSAAAK